MKALNLVIVHTPGDQDIADWRLVAGKVETAAPEIEVRIAGNLHRNSTLRRWQKTRPSLVFSAGVLREFKPQDGKVYAGALLSKWEQLTRLQAGGINVPPTELWRKEVDYKPEIWGERVIVKPLIGRRGRGIRLLPTAGVRENWGSLTKDGTVKYLVQKFVDTGAHPNHYRVLTGFGAPLYMIRNWAAKADGTRQAAPGDDRWCLVSDGDGRIDLDADEAVLSFARAMAAALPEIPVLGCDIVREEAGGNLFALEANTFGQTWHFSSDTHREFVASHQPDLDYYAQFDGLELLANELVRRTRAEAI